MRFSKCEFDNRASGASWQVWMDRHRLPLLGLGLAGLLGIALLRGARSRSERA